MKSSLEHADKIWRRVRMIFFLSPISIALIVGINIANGTGGSALELIGGGLLMFAFFCLVFGCCWLIFRLVRFAIEMGEGSR